MSETSAPEAEPIVWWLAADDAGALLSLLDERAGTLDRPPTDDPPERPALTAIGRGPARLGIVDPDERKVRLARRMLTEGQPWRGRSDLWFTPTGLADTGSAGSTGSAGKVAFLFPGVEPTFGAEGTDLPALGQRLGLDAPEVSADTIAHRSASIVRLGIFLGQVLRRLGVEPDLVAGHSIGEWSASVASGMFTRQDADRLLDGIDLGGVELPDLDFAAMSTGADAVGTVVAGIEGIVVSHDNCPGQSVICGPPHIVERALAALRDAGILGYTLDFQSGFHTPFIEPSLVAFRHYLEGLTIAAPAIPLWSATTTGLYPSDRAEIIDLHLRHLVEPVRFRPMIERLYHEAGARIFVQAGIGTLTGFVDDTLGPLDHACVQVLSPKRSALAQAYRAVTALWVEGLDVRPDALRGRQVPARAAVPDSAPAAVPPSSPAAPGSITGPGAAPAAAPVPAAAAATPASIPAPEKAPAAAAAAASSMTAVAGGARSAAATAVAGDAGGPAYPLLAAAELLTAAARASQDVLDALSARISPPAFPTAPPPAWLQPAPPAKVAGRPAAAAPPPVHSATAAPPAAAAASQVQSAGAPPPDGRARAWPAGKTVITRHLSLETMPETLDHSLYHQPPGWPDVTDGFPIVAMTTQIQLLQDVAAEFAGGREVVEVFGVRNLRWLDLSAPQDVDVTIVPKADDVLNVALGGYCRANIRVGEFRPAPQHDRVPLANSHPTAITSQEMFERRVMFHGPRFQGITTLGPTGDDGILGEFHNLGTPGSLLDNLGKIVAYWVIEQRNPGESPLPIGVDRIEFFGPRPRPGIDLHCDVRILELQPEIVRADGVIVLPNGEVWCRVEGWTSNVFHIDQVMEPIYHETEDNYAVEPQPGGWNVVIERWPTGAGRDLTARRFLSRAERGQYEGKNLLEQRRWLIDVIAAKDSVRRWLGERGILAYPVEVGLVAEGAHRFRAVCPLIPEGHDLHITVSSLHWLAVAIVGDGAYLDIEAREVVEGADAEVVAQAAAEAVRGRNPGTSVAAVDRVDAVTPSNIPVVVIPRFAVAWTEDPSPPRP